MASIQHLGGTTWRVRIPLPRDPDGKRRSKSVSFQASGKRAAEKKAADLISDHNKTEQARAAQAGSVAQMLDDWLAAKSKTVSPTTLPAYRLRCDKIKARFGRTAAVELTGRDIDRWYIEIVDKVGTAEVQHIHRVFRAALRWGRRRGYVTTVETELAEPPQHHQFEIRPPTPDALRVLLDGLPETEWARAVRLAAFTGMRRGEIVALRWERLDGLSVVVSNSVAEVKGARVVKLPKGKRTRAVTIDAAVVEVLAEQRAHLAAIGLSSPWVFPDWRSDSTGKTPRGPGWLSKAWEQHRAKFNGQAIRLHDLRHAYATRALDAGAPVTAVAAQLGHAQTSTTVNIYGHSTDPGREAVASAGVLGLQGSNRPHP